MVLTKATRRFLEKAREQRIQRQTQQTYGRNPNLMPPSRAWNQFAENQNNVSPTADVLDILFGGGGERLMDLSWNRQIGVSLPDTSLDDIMGDVLAEKGQDLWGNNQPQRRMMRRRR